MSPDHFRFGGGAAESTMGAPVLVALLLAIALVLLLPRRYVVVPVLLGIFLVPQGSVLVVAGVHVGAERLIAAFGCLRLVFTKATSQTPIFEAGFNVLDKAFFLWALFRAIAFTVLWSDTAAAINQAGFLWSTIGTYLLLRFLIRDEEDITTALKTFALIAAIQAVEMVGEQMTLTNMFGTLLGGVSSVTGVREGRVRSQGVFQHAILAGAFGATMMPLFIRLWQTGAAKFAAAVGILSATVIAWTAASSTSVLTTAAVIAAILFWPLRNVMSPVRKITLMVLVTVHLVMKAPVWFLIARVDLIAGNSGYHRALLIDQFIRNFGDWWLFGTKNNGDWGFDMWDMSNQFVAEGIAGGLITFVCFVAIIVFSFKRIGRLRKFFEGYRSEEWSMWLLGVALVGHCVAFFGVSYWDQTDDAWFAFLAIISAATRQLDEPLPELHDWSEADDPQAIEA
jgi:hypothetical protein